MKHLLFLPAWMRPFRRGVVLLAGEADPAVLLLLVGPVGDVLVVLLAVPQHGAQQAGVVHLLVVGHGALLWNSLRVAASLLDPS